MQTSKIISNTACQPKAKDSILNFLWLDNTTNNDIVIGKICERNLCSKEVAAAQLTEYHKFLYCLGKEFRLNELLQDQMLLFPSAIVSRIWRLHQLFTQEYPSLCRDLGFNFISFNPEKLCFWSKSEKEIERLRPVYEKTLSALKKDFKGELNEDVWPSNYDDMVKQHLLSFHVNLTTYKAIENTVNNLNGILKFSDMSISEIKNKVIPELRKELPQFKETTFELQTPESQSAKSIKIFNLLKDIQFPAEMISHLQNEYLLTAQSTEQLIKEYKKFFMMFLVNKSFSQVPSAFVDEAWHTHINFAKIYANSCSALAGGMINHIPATNQVENEQELMSKEFEQTMELYEKLFGKVNEQYWQLTGEFRDDQQNFFWVDLFDSNKKAQVECQDCFNVKVTDEEQLEESNSTEASSENKQAQKFCGECFLLEEKKKESCNGCTGDCNGLVQQKKSCNGCTGDCNGLVQQKKSCNGCTGECNGLVQQKKSCNGCTGECNGLVEKKSCNGCTGDCNGLVQQKKSCNGCTGECNGLVEKKSCNGCTGECNGFVQQKKSCNGCTGDCNGLVQQKKSCNGCTGDCNGLVQEKKSRNGCTGDCNGKAQQKKSCSGCTGECNGKTVQKKSCNGCTGDCNGLVQQKKSCNGCTGECNGLVQQKKSCNGCTGDCNGKTQQKKSCSGCTGECNGKTQQKKSCNGCTGECNGLVQQKKSCNGCTGECNGFVQQKKSCNGCTGECNGKTQQKKSCNGCTGECNGKAQQKKSCNGCTGECNGFVQEKKSCNGCTGECNGFVTMKKSNKNHDVKTSIVEKAKLIRFCGDCFLLSEQAFQKSKQNFVSVIESAQKLNDCGNCDNEEQALKRAEQLKMITGSHLIIVQ